MKIKVYIKRFTKDNEPLVDFPKVIQKGDWVDLRTAEEVSLQAPQAGTLKGKESKHRDVRAEVTYIPLGVAMQLPNGFEAIAAARSSTPKNLGVICANGVGIIDNSYKGDNDQWHFPALPIRNTTIPRNTRICQFKIQLSQKATMLQKLKWMLSSGIELVEVNNLDNVNRGGLGSTNKKK